MRFVFVSLITVIALLSLCPFNDLGAFEMVRPPSDPQSQSISARTSFTLDPHGLELGTGLLSVPVLKSERDGISLGAKYSRLDLTEEQSSYSILSVVEGSAQYTHKIKEGTFYGFNGAFGSASDDLFYDSSVTTLSATALYGFEQTRESSWLLLLNYSNHRSFLNHVPLPGFAYTYAPSKELSPKELRMTFGVPFASIYRKWNDRWSITLFTVVPWVAKVQVSYSIFGNGIPVSAFFGLEWAQLSFLKARRANEDERLIYDDKRAMLGIRSPLSRTFFAELESGLAVDRRLFEAESYTPDPDHHATKVTHLEPSPYLKFTLSGKF